MPFSFSFVATTSSAPAQQQQYRCRSSSKVTRILQLRGSISNSGIALQRLSWLQLQQLQLQLQLHGCHLRHETPASSSSAHAFRHRHKLQLPWQHRTSAAVTTAAAPAARYLIWRHAISVSAATQLASSMHLDSNLATCDQRLSSSCSSSAAAPLQLRFSDRAPAEALQRLHLSASISAAMLQRMNFIHSTSASAISAAARQ